MSTTTIPADHRLALFHKEADEHDCGLRLQRESGAWEGTALVMLLTLIDGVVTDSSVEAVVLTDGHVLHTGVIEHEGPVSYRTNAQDRFTEIIGGRLSCGGVRVDYEQIRAIAV